MRRLVSTAFLFCALLVSPTIAAASTHEYLGVFAAGVPQDPPPPPGVGERPQDFRKPCGIALSESQNAAVAVYHGSGYSVAFFDQNGAYLGKQQSPLSTNGPCDLVYAGSPQHLFGVMFHGAAYDLTQGTVLDSERSTGVAAGPGDRIYVAHRHHVSVYESDGTSAFSVGDAGSLGNAYGVAVDAAGKVYVGDAESNSVKVFDPSVDPLVPVLVIDGSGTARGSFSDLTDTDVAIAQNGDLLVVDNLESGLEDPRAALYEFSPTGAYVGEISHWTILVPASDVDPAHYEARWLVHTRPTGVAVGSDGTIYVTSGKENEEVVYRFAADTTPTSTLQVLGAGNGEGSVEVRTGTGSDASSGGIQCGLPCTAEFKNGETVSLIAKPSAHSEFLGWAVAGQPNACLDPNSSCQVTLSGSVNVTANFRAIPQRELNVSVSGQGLVSSTPIRLSCRSQCSAEFDEGSQVTLTPEAAEGFRFIGFSGACSGQADCSVTMTSDASVDLHFVPATAPERLHPPAPTSPLLVIAGGSGTGSVASEPGGLDCGLVCSAMFATGTEVTLKASADPGSRFVGWSGCDTVISGRCRVGVSGPRNITASFSEGSAVELGRLVTRRSKTSLAVAVAEAGRLTLKGKGLRGGSRRVAGAVKLALPLQLDKKGLRAIAADGLLRSKVVVSFDPAGEAAPETSKKTVVLRRGAGR